MKDNPVDSFADADPTPSTPYRRPIPGHWDMVAEPWALYNEGTKEDKSVSSDTLHCQQDKTATVASTCTICDRGRTVDCPCVRKIPRTYLRP